MKPSAPFWGGMQTPPFREYRAKAQECKPRMSSLCAEASFPTFWVYCSIPPVQPRTSDTTVRLKLFQQALLHSSSYYKHIRL